MTDAARPPRWYLLLSNPSKTTHLGTLLRCAAAFKVHQFLLVGCDKFNCRGSFGSHLFVDILVFRSWESVGQYLDLGGDDTIDTVNNGNNDVVKSDTLDDDSKCHMNQDTFCKGNEQTHTGEEEKAKKNQHPVPVIGILGAYGGGEEIFSPEGVEVHIDEGSYVSLVPPKVGDQLNVADDRTQNNQENVAGASCIPSHSFPISARPFPTEDICFILSKDKRGLPLSQARLCTRFIHVPHLSFDSALSLDIQQQEQPSQSMSETNGTHITHSTLIDTATTLSIVLHHYTAWAGYEERPFADNQKFVKDVKPNARRRLCRLFGENGITTRHDDDSIEISEEHDNGSETLLCWNKADGVANRCSDY